MRLADISVKQKAYIIDFYFSQENRKRLFYLGFYKNCVIEKIAQAPLHDPCLYRIHDNIYFLRNIDAMQIEVEAI